MANQRLWYAPQTPAMPKALKSAMEFCSKLADENFENLNGYMVFDVKAYKPELLATNGQVLYRITGISLQDMQDYVVNSSTLFLDGEYSPRECYLIPGKKKLHKGKLMDFPTITPLVRLDLKNHFFTKLSEDVLVVSKDIDLDNPIQLMGVNFNPEVVATILKQCPKHSELVVQVDSDTNPSFGAFTFYKDDLKYEVLAMGVRG